VSVLPGGSALDFGGVSARTREFKAPEHVLIETRHDAGSRGNNIFADKTAMFGKSPQGRTPPKPNPGQDINAYANVGSFRRLNSGTERRDSDPTRLSIET